MPIAEKYIEYAKTDGTEETWKGEVPVGKNLMASSPQQMGSYESKMETFDTSKSGAVQDQGRHQMIGRRIWKELREFNESHESSDIAWK